jgi:ATP phosphoribosyltransferase
VIVDIVETGTTLRENNLSVYERIAPSSARLIANVSSYKFKQQEITKMVNALSEAIANG